MTSAVDAGSGINYATWGNYAPDGSLTGFVSGNSASFTGITNTFTYNNRLQPVNMSALSPSQTVFSESYDFHLGNGDNDNVFALINNKDTTRNQTFTYDALNRLISAQNAGTDCSQKTANGGTKYWGNNYGYDAWGNLLTKSVTKCSAENLSVTALANNQLSGYGYDAAGNMTHDVTFGHTYAYDAESRILHVDGSGATYTYNSLGNRVRKDVSSGPSTEYFNFGGEVLAELNPATGAFTNYIYFDGNRVARRDGTTGPVSYYFSDHLKTTDIVTDALGNIKNESDFYPWGAEMQLVNNDSNHYKFTGKERDAETNLDYFGARYYSNGLGRFITPDWSAVPVPVPYADLEDPQTLNQYSYVRNIPTVKVDADGHDGCCTLSDLARLVDEGYKAGKAMIDALRPAAPAAPAAGAALATVGPAAVLALPSVGAMNARSRRAEVRTACGRQRLRRRLYAPPVYIHRRKPANPNAAAGPSQRC